jgi:hypothetical protein
VKPHDKPQASGLEDQAVSGNLFPPVFGLVGIGLLAFTVWALGLPETQVADGLSHCGAMTNDRARLACYDKLATPPSPARGALAPFHANSREGSQ